jgi:hypothetical protein
MITGSREMDMAKKWFFLEEMITMLQEAEVLLIRSNPLADECLFPTQVQNISAN